MSKSNTRLPASLVLLLATSTGMSVASLYYAQPMLQALSRDMLASTSTIGLEPTLNQLGYAP